MSTPPAPAARRRRRWLVIPLVLIGLLAAVTAWAYVRGTSATGDASNPTTPGQTTAHLLAHDGRTSVRAAILLPYPRDRVWAVVTDYAHYDQFLPYLDDIAVERHDDGCHMTGGAQSVVSGYWPFAIDIHERKGTYEWSAEWDQVPDDKILVNRGRWALSERGKDTLLVLTLETEVKGYPNFVLRNVFLHRLPLVLRSIEARLRKEENQ
jgi:hypothetical protein